MPLWFTGCFNFLCRPSGSKTFFEPDLLETIKQQQPEKQTKSVDFGERGLRNIPENTPGLAQLRSTMRILRLYTIPSIFRLLTLSHMGLARASQTLQGSDWVLNGQEFDKRVGLQSIRLAHPT